MWFVGPIAYGGTDVDEYIDEDASLGTLLKRNVRDLYGKRFLIARGDADGPHQNVAYSLPGDPEVYESVQPVYYLEADPALFEGRIYAASIGSREVEFLVMQAPEHKTHPFPMASCSVHGGTYPAEIAKLTDLFRDSSWKNDVCDSITFGIRGKPYTIWVQPAAPIRRFEDGPPSRYELTELQTEDDLEDALDSHTIDYDADVIHFDEPEDLLEYIRSMTDESDLAKRTRLLELGPKRGSYDPKKHGRGELDEAAAQRAALLELDLDDLKINGRRRRARRNPDDVAAAKEKFEEFHRHKPRKIFEGKSPIPAKVRELGKAKAVLYRSDKNDPDTGRAVKHPINYIHDHDAGVHCYTPASGGTIPVPAFIRDAEALVLLGKCLGFDFEDASGLREAKGIKPYPDLYATPCGKALLVIQDRRQVLAIVWGGGLGVEARGIVG